MAETMKSVVIHGPGKVSIQERPVPKILHPTDVVLKVKYTALCGSELHVYRGHEKCDSYDFIMGHEFCGAVVEVGSSVSKFKIGDYVVSPFTTSCGQCFYCEQGQSCRCEKGQLYGSQSLDGGQAQYVRVPLADSTLFPVPKGIDDKLVILMADIFPTGYFAASNGLKYLSPEQRKEAVVVVVGCGPVGLCTIVSALSFVDKVYAIDSVSSRLELAEKMGAIPIHLTENDPKKIIEGVTDGRGADVVLEIVGRPEALRLAFDLLRRFGRLSSIGVHTEDVPFTAAEAYDKNLQIQFGRCPVRSIFAESLEVLSKNTEKLSSLIDTYMPLEGAAEAYDIFEKRKVQKVVFTFDH